METIVLSTFNVCGKCTIIFNLPNGISKSIGNMLYVSKLAKNLLSISQLIEQGFKVEFEIIGWSFLIQTRWLLKWLKKEGYINWLELFNPWFYMVGPRLKGMICAIRNSNMSLCKL